MKKNVVLQRTKDGFFVGSNFPNNPKLIKEETDFYKSEEGGGNHRDYYLVAYDRDEAVPLAEAAMIGCSLIFRRASGN